MKTNLDVSTSAALRYKIAILRDGKTISETKFRNHMITDVGLDNVATKNWLGQLSYPIIGENSTPTPVRRDSGAITFTQTGTSIVASGNFFLAADTGRLLKYGAGEAGEEVYVTYLTATTATASRSLSQAAISGVLWYVNTAAIITPVTGLTWSRMTNAVENFTNSAVNGSTVTLTHQQTVYSSALTVAKTITEIAFNDTNTNTNVFDRDVITPGISLLIGDQAKVTVQLICRYSPVTQTAVANIATGYDSAGLVQLESLGVANTTGVDSYNSGGTGGWGGGGRPLDPANMGGTVGYFSAVTSALNFQAYNDNTQTSRTVVNCSTLVKQSYGTGNRYVDYLATFSISVANGTINGFTISNLFTLKLTTPLVKTSSQVLTFTFRKSWNRVLSN